MPVLPIVWILGASGVGKSTTGFLALQQLDAAGVVCALVDADQLRLARGVDSTETQLIAGALPVLEREFRARGARALIVSGVADDAVHLSALLTGLARSRLLIVHLDVDGGTLRDRIRRRGSLLEEMEENVAAAAAIDPGWADVRIDTSNATPDVIAAAIVAATRVFLRGEDEVERMPAAHALPVPVPVPAPAHAVLISGAGGSGVSTVGYAVYSGIATRGRAVGYLDAYQLGFLGPGIRSDALAPLRAANVRTVSDVLRRAGAETIVVTGDARTVRLLSESWAGADTTVVWLDASHEALAERIAERARGRGPAIPGDHRRGLSGRALDDAIAAAVAETRDRAQLPPDTMVVDTSALSPGAAADRIVDVAAAPRR